MNQDHKTNADADVIEETRRFAEHAKDYYHTIQENENPLVATYRKNPYAVIAGAAGLGYLLAGGLFTPFTRRVLRMGTKALVIPALASQAKGFMSLPEEQ